MLNKNKVIYIAGHNGLVGKSILKNLKKHGYKKLLYKSRKELDLLDQLGVKNFFKSNKIDAVIIAAAKVGGIHANNTYKAEFIFENLQIQNNLIHESYKKGIKDLIFLGSSCIYPKFSKQPIKEEYLLSGKLETTNEPYALAKIAGIKMCEFYSQQYNLNYKCLMPTNLYGPGDNYDLEKSHFLPALIRKAHECKLYNKKFIEIWGSGKPKRELLFVDDLSDAIIFFLGKKTKDHLINIGSNTEKSIYEYLKIINDYFKINPKIVFDKKKPDGTFRKKLNLNKTKKYKWKAKTSFKEGLDITIKCYLESFRNR